MTSVIVADDHVPTRSALVEALEDDGFEVLGAFADGPAAVAAARATNPELVLLDVAMPGSGLIAVGDIVRSCPDTTVVMLTVSRDDADLVHALRAGAAGFIHKGVDFRQIPALCRAVLAGESVLPRSVLGLVAQEFSRNRIGSVGSERLSDREAQVLDMLRRGRTTQEIAEELFVASVTVRSHVAAIVRKLRVGSRDEAIAVTEHG